MKRTFTSATILLLSLAACEQPSLPSSRVFSDPEHNVSFRYPYDWESVPAQAAATLVLLYARDGSQATCNLSVTPATVVTPESISAKDAEETLRTIYKDAHVTDRWITKTLAGTVLFLEYDYTLGLPAQDVPSSGVAMIAVRNGFQYSLILSALRDRVDEVRPDFDLMAGTLAFGL